jgi:hypothetical protein
MALTKKEVAAPFDAASFERKLSSWLAKKIPTLSHGGFFLTKTLRRERDYSKPSVSHELTTSGGSVRTLPADLQTLP